MLARARRSRQVVLNVPHWLVVPPVLEPVSSDDAGEVYEITQREAEVEQRDG